jgi:hypothetical protein
MIDYALLDRSIKFYEEFGFTRIETPWMVTDYVDQLTRPKGAIPYHVPNKNKNFVASGEQSFLYLYLKEYLPMGRFQTITPCLRNDPFDLTHTKYFMKNELIITDKVNTTMLEFVMHRALEFFREEVSQQVVPLKTRYGWDLMLGDIELGSYGIRHADFLSWIYGTGCAEPRTTRAIYGISQKENNKGKTWRVQ